MVRRALGGEGLVAGGGRRATGSGGQLAGADEVCADARPKQFPVVCGQGPCR